LFRVNYGVVFIPDYVSCCNEVNCSGARRTSSRGATLQALLPRYIPTLHPQQGRSQRTAPSASLLTLQQPPLVGCRDEGSTLEALSLLRHALAAGQILLDMKLKRLWGSNNC